MLYSHCHIELVAINFQLIVCPSCVTEPRFGITTSQISMDKRAVTHCLDIVYRLIIAGRRLIIG